MTRLILILAVATGAVALSVSPVEASCTREYTQCLNDSWYLEPALQRAADIECLASYTGCVIGELRFW